MVREDGMNVKVGKGNLVQTNWDHHGLMDELFFEHTGYRFAENGGKSERKPSTQ